MITQSKDFLTEQNISRIPKKGTQSRNFLPFFLCVNNINVNTLAKIKTKRELASIFCNFYLDKVCQQSLDFYLSKSYTTSKTETKFIFPIRSHSLKHIFSHLVILCKHVLPDLHLTLTASRYYTEWNAAIRSTYSEQYSYPEQ